VTISDRLTSGNGLVFILYIQYLTVRQQVFD